MSVATHLVLRLDGAGSSADKVGGKGRWLDRLAAAGFPVPPAVALTTDAYAAVARQPPIARLLDEIRSTPVPPPAQQEAARNRIDTAFRDVPLPPQVHEAIDWATGLCRAGGATDLAVRSSATAEDMSEISFAGQYRSFLDLADDAAVERAIRLVWASLWHPAPCAYRRFHGVDESELGMAVIVMPMVVSQRAGVAFSWDPGGSGSVRVESVSGSGEQLVSGRTTPDVDLVPRELAGAAGGDGAGTLSVRVAALAVAVEKAFGPPQDIEWAFAGNRLLLLQARPITTSPSELVSDGFDTPSRPGERWTTAGISEMLPDALPPLVWDTAGLLVEESFRELFDALGSVDGVSLDVRIIGRFRCRAALNLSALQLVAAAMPGTSPDDIERQYFGKSAGQSPATGAGESRGFLAGIHHDLSVLALNRRADREAETVAEAIRRVLDTPPETDRPLEELMQLRRRLLDLAGRTATAETAVAAAAVAAYRQLEHRLSSHLGDRAGARRTQQLTASVPAGFDWGELLPDVGNPEILAILDGAPDWDAALPRLEHAAGGAEWAAAVTEAARRAGSRSVFAGPTWDEDPQRVWTAVRHVMSRNSGQETDRQEELEREWSALVVELEASPQWRLEGATTAGIYDFRLAALRSLLANALDHLGRRERTKAALMSLGGQVRRVHAAIGCVLAARGIIPSATDVELLGGAELTAIAAGSPGPGAPELMRRRRWVQRCAAEGPLPPIFHGQPPAARAMTPQGGTAFRGWGASPGRYIGRPAVLRDSGGHVEPGDVLVAQTTDASWSPLFLIAGAIVVEQGGPLSHAAIVARELGIPAVLNVPGIAARAHSAARIDVDGDEGLVVLS